MSESPSESQQALPADVPDAPADAPAKPPRVRRTRTHSATKAAVPAGADEVVAKKAVAKKAAAPKKPAVRKKAAVEVVASPAPAPASEVEATSEVEAASVSTIAEHVAQDRGDPVTKVAAGKPPVPERPADMVDGLLGCVSESYDLTLVPRESVNFRDMGKMLKSFQRAVGETLGKIGDAVWSDGAGVRRSNMTHGVPAVVEAGASKAAQYGLPDAFTAYTLMVDSSADSGPFYYRPMADYALTRSANGTAALVRQPEATVATHQRMWSACLDVWPRLISCVTADFVYRPDLTGPSTNPVYQVLVNLGMKQTRQQYRFLALMQFTAEGADHVLGGVGYCPEDGDVKDMMTTECSMFDTALVQATLRLRAGCAGTPFFGGADCHPVHMALLLRSGLLPTGAPLDMVYGYVKLGEELYNLQLGRNGETTGSTTGSAVGNLLSHFRQLDERQSERSMVTLHLHEWRLRLDEDFGHLVGKPVENPRKRTARGPLFPRGSQSDPYWNSMGHWFELISPLHHKHRHPFDWVQLRHE